MRRSAVLGIAVSALVLTGVQPVHGCLVEGPSSIRWTLEYRQPLGVYEQTTIAAAPQILFRAASTASVVTQSWGAPPAATGVQVEGGELSNPLRLLPYFDTGDCSSIDRSGHVITPDGPTGTISYGYVSSLDDDETWRSAPGIVARPKSDDQMFGPLSAKNLTRLDEHFGPPTRIEVSLWTQIEANLAVWGPSLLILAHFGGLAYASLLALWRKTQHTEGRSVPTLHSSS